MGIDELIVKAKQSSQKRTREEKIQMLKDAKIIGEDGFYLEEFFSKETIEKDRKANIPIQV